MQNDGNLVTYRGNVHRDAFGMVNGYILEITDREVVNILNSLGGHLRTVFNRNLPQGTYTLSVTNDAKISIKNGNGVEQWKDYPKTP